MALNRKFNVSPDDDELDALRERYALLQREKEALQKQVKALQEKPRAPKPQKQPKRSSIFLILAAFMVSARLILYIVVENWGARASVIGLGLSAFFGFAVLCVLVLWAFSDRLTDGWIVVGTAIFLLVAILICGSIFDPVLLETGVAGPVQKPVTAAAALISCFLFAASGMTRWVMGFLLLFVTDPRKVFRR
jgi:hypothetical protein